MKKVDCRGMTCPQPVVETKKALEGPGIQEILILVDNPTSRENVSRFAASQGYQVNITDEQGYSALTIRKGEEVKEEGGPFSKATGAGDLVFFLDSDSMGRGSKELGGILMRSFLHTLAETDLKPRKVILVNSGVKLACEGSAVLDDLGVMDSQGVEILACGTCLNYFEIKDKLRVGRVSNMYEILDALAGAGKTVII
jgi:selenium metabolism protein YedF